MKKLKLILDSLDDLPEHFHELYTEKDGKFVLTGIENMPSADEVKKLKTEAGARRIELADLKKKYASLDDKGTPDEILAQLDRIEELEAAASGKIDDDKINTMVEARVKKQLAPVERERDKLKKDLDEATGKINEFSEKDRKRQIHDEVRKHALKSKIVDTAIEDVLLHAERIFDIDEDGKIVTKDGVGVTPNVGADLWLTDMQQARPHWWPPSQGGGAGGGTKHGDRTNNPWTHENWNLTEQGKVVKADRKKADDLARMAGTTVGGPKPNPKK